MHVDFKITSWERVEIPDGKESEAMALLESEEVLTSDDLINKLEGTTYTGHLPDTDGMLTFEENGHCETIEAFDDNGNIVWRNISAQKPERTITLTMSELAEVVTYGTITGVTLAGKRGTEREEFGERIKKGYITDLGNMTDEKIKSLTKDFYIQVKTGKINTNEEG